MPIEKSFLDRMINSGYLGKRRIGQFALKHNVREKGFQGWVELVFAPRNQVEQVVSQVMKFIHPYLFFITYRFHVEKAREVGMRVEDVYCNKFHKEPYIMHHLYAQHFHPHTMLERVRDVRFYRHPRTLFKGFTVPDWAQADQRYGWDFDAYSRQAWDNAMHDLRSEWTPMQYVGESRQEPNVFQWMRWEQYGKGFSSRLFFNEVPQPTWYRHGGHMLADDKDEKEREMQLHSFCHADQGRGLIFGMDTTTEEGRAAFRAEFEALAELAPEVVKKEDMVYPHEMAPQISNEPHFQRVFNHYRVHAFRNAVQKAIDNGAVSSEDAAAAQSYLGATPSFNVYSLTAGGKLSGDNEGFQATQRVMQAIGLGEIEFNNNSAEPLAEQFQTQFDVQMGLSEEGMAEELDAFVSDPASRAAVDALNKDRAASLE